MSSDLQPLLSVYSWRVWKIRLSSDFLMYKCFSIPVARSYINKMNDLKKPLAPLGSLHNVDTSHQNKLATVKSHVCVPAWFQWTGTSLISAVACQVGFAR